MTETTEAATPDEYAAGKILIEEYCAALGIDLCFQHFDEELSSLLAMYGPPGGCLLLARKGMESVGCVAVRGLENGVCEVKRLYVRPNYRRLRLGRRLAEDAIGSLSPFLCYRRAVRNGVESSGSPGGRRSGTFRPVRGNAPARSLRGSGGSAGQGVPGG